MDDSTKIITLKMNTAEAQAVSCALLYQASEVLILARHEKDFDKRAACYRIHRLITEVRTRIDNAFSDRPIGGTCKHGVAFSTQCPECLGYFAREKENEAGFIPMLGKQAD